MVFRAFRCEISVDFYMKYVIIELQKFSVFRRFVCFILSKAEQVAEKRKKFAK